jgi:hypothetical protein
MIPLTPREALTRPRFRRRRHSFSSGTENLNNGGGKPEPAQLTTIRLSKAEPKNNLMSSCRISNGIRHTWGAGKQGEPHTAHTQRAGSTTPTGHVLSPQKTSSTRSFCHSHHLFNLPPPPRSSTNCIRTDLSSIYFPTSGSSAQHCGAKIRNTLYTSFVGTGNQLYVQQWIDCPGPPLSCPTSPLPMMSALRPEVSSSTLGPPRYSALLAISTQSCGGRQNHMVAVFDTV